MEAFILQGPEQLKEAALACRAIPRNGPINAALLLGMGGSALGGGLIDLLRASQGHRWPWAIIRDVRLTWQPDHETRVFALSYSGTTAETLATYEQARVTNPALVSVSAGGQLATVAAAYGLPHIAIPPRPEGFQPRFALPFMFGVLYEILQRDGLLRAPVSLPHLADDLAADDTRALGRELAEWLGDRTPVIYTDTPYEAGVARTWKIKFNENSKRVALAGALPEVNHNELIAFPPESADRFAFLLLPDPDAPPAIARRFRLFARLMEQYGYPVRTVPLQGRTLLHKALGSLQLADWVSLYAARSAGIDPIAIPAIRDFKKLLQGEPE